MRDKNEKIPPQFLLVRLNKEQHDFLKSFSQRMGRSMSGQLAFVVDELKKKYGAKNEHSKVS